MTFGYRIYDICWHFCLMHLTSTINSEVRILEKSSFADSCYNNLIVCLVKQLLQILLFFIRKFCCNILQITILQKRYVVDFWYTFRVEWMITCLTSYDTKIHTDRSISLHGTGFVSVHQPISSLIPNPWDS